MKQGTKDLLTVGAFAAGLVYLGFYSPFSGLGVEATGRRRKKRPGMFKPSCAQLQRRYKNIISLMAEQNCSSGWAKPGGGVKPILPGRPEEPIPPVPPVPPQEMPPVDISDVAPQIPAMWT